MKTLLPFEKMKREILVRKRAKTSPKFGKPPKERSIEELLDYGIINVDKNKGPTSHQVSAYVQQILGIKKAGHSGTLDPAVTGVLPVALGRGTRIVQALLNAGKEYVVIMHLHKKIDETKVRAVIASFVGKIKQLPPIKSAVKRQWRYRKVYYIEVIEIDGQDVLMKIGCQAGTYIRKICHDMGQELGTGAHMAELRRTKAGPFNESTLINLMTLKDEFVFYKELGKEEEIKKAIQPIEAGVDHFPKIWVFDTTVDSLCHGANLHVPGISKVESDIQVDEPVAVMTLKEELVCLGQVKMISREMLKKERGLAVNVKKVFMLPGTYPKIEKG